MLGSHARSFSLLSRLYGSSRLATIGRCTGIAVALMAAGGSSLQIASAESDTRTLSFHNVHTGEDLTVTFKRNGRYDEAALKRLNWYLRDWRKSEDVKMDPHLFDLLWVAYQETGATQPINVICGYRSPSTNAMLRARSSGVAQGSLHTHGQALDFFIPGVPLAKIREVGLKMQRGGVGFYPTSGSPFVHLDTGTIRHWPRMTREQLVKVFPNERTVHVPSDGKPLAGFALALADVERQGRAPSNVLLANARDAGAIDEDDVATATTLAANSATPEAKVDKPKGSTLLASFFGFKPGTDAAGKTKTDLTKTDLTKTDLANTDPARTNPAKAGPKANDKIPMPLARVQTASLTAPTPVPVERIVPVPKMRPGATTQLASVTPTAMPRTRPAAAPVAVAAVTAGDLFAERGLWTSIAQDKANQLADQMTTASTGPVLAYASPDEAQPPRHAATRAAPMGKVETRIETASLAPIHISAPPAPAPAATAAKLGQIGERFDDPWMRGIVMTPSVRGFMTTAQMVRRDNRTLQPMMRKPDSSVLMAFGDDPHHGMTTDRFSGQAVVFLATATFRLRTTAALTIR
ncbi:MAG: DUF882 domain-containing protein [Xanthobacteraceae bacterium]|uniref:DUF882 domain-containing protein n=1 Tax=Pseudolabrys sp. TaxID=1960880 RepID=UPI003D0CBF13